MMRLVSRIHKSLTFRKSMSRARSTRLTLESLESRELLAGDTAPGWAVQLGSTGSDRLRDLQAGPDGGLYMVGHFSNTVDFDPGAATSNLSSAGGEDGFVAKYTTDHELLWVRSLAGSSGDEQINEVDFDAAGNIYLAG
ncbi:MAG: hypothetical protein KDA60_04505, partial [Planctomycetales bacterium]|nr:hypothetical protein [Planctomycetales bacterium]